MVEPPPWKICSSNWIISPGKGEHKKCLRPPPRWLIIQNNQEFPCDAPDFHHQLRTMGSSKTIQNNPKQPTKESNNNNQESTTLQQNCLLHAGAIHGPPNSFSCISVVTREHCPRHLMLLGPVGNPKVHCLKTTISNKKTLPTGNCRKNTLKNTQKLSIFLAFKISPSEACRIQSANGPRKTVRSLPDIQANSQNPSRSWLVMGEIRIPRAANQIDKNPWFAKKIPDSPKQMMCLLQCHIELWKHPGHSWIPPWSDEIENIKPSRPFWLNKNHPFFVRSVLPNTWSLVSRSFCRCHCPINEGWYRVFLVVVTRHLLSFPWGFGVTTLLTQVSCRHLRDQGSSDVPQNPKKGLGHLKNRAIYHKNL